MIQSNVIKKAIALLCIFFLTACTKSSFLESINNDLSDTYSYKLNVLDNLQNMHVRVYSLSSNRQWICLFKESQLIQNTKYQFNIKIVDAKDEAKSYIYLYYGNDYNEHTVKIIEMENNNGIIYEHSSSKEKLEIKRNQEYPIYAISYIIGEQDIGISLNDFYEPKQLGSQDSEYIVTIEVT